MVLKGGMVAITAILLTAFHPGLAFGWSGWSGTAWKLSGKLRIGEFLMKRLPRLSETVLDDHPCFGRGKII